MGVGKIIMTSVLLLIMISLMSVFSMEHSTPAIAHALNSTQAVAIQNFSTKIYDPLNSSIISGVNSSSNLASSSTSIGFALAFILPNFIATLKAVINTPYLISFMMQNLISPINTGGVPVGLYVSYGIDVLIMYVLLWGLSLWMKMPTW